MKQFAKLPCTDATLNRVQDALVSVLAQLTQNPMLSGHFLPAVKLVSGSNIINHGLKQAYQACFVSLPTASDVTLQEGTSPDRSQFVNIIASEPTTISIYTI